MPHIPLPDSIEKRYIPLLSLLLEKFITNPCPRLSAWNGGSEALPQVNLKGGSASDLPFPGGTVETRYFQDLIEMKFQFILLFSTTSDLLSQRSSKMAGRWLNCPLEAAGE
ncbi:hypothetical protein J5X98_01050 [Leptothermofonsia sichuanensis E412]|uniref:hypothetical protein n=1 Tax=Leptothermofonsia sichuanensis TaxID=2917832 RepID=UPI001CA7714E|nr:hypothetical protein [Leptothermofonsia sichuanensis]QZZ21128.1 hypothetical protein J5X98_01050 [Leptothermofonsia sichuanensis E412]